MSAPLREFTDYVNIQQLLRFAQGELPLYTQPEIEAVILEVSQRHRDRLGNKGEQKCSPLVEEGVVALREHAQLSPTELRSLVADCRDAGRLPGELIQYLKLRIDSNKDVVLPLLASLIFSRFIGISSDLRTLAQWIVKHQPELIDDLTQIGISTGCLSMHASTITEEDASTVAASIWCVDGKLLSSQRYLPTSRGFARDVELARVQRIQFAKLCGTRYKGESISSRDSTLFPSLQRLESFLNQRGDPWRLTFTRQRWCGVTTEHVLSLMPNQRGSQVIHAEHMPGEGSWLVALERGATAMLEWLEAVGDSQVDTTSPS
jgi:hypothetical protein